MRRNQNPLFARFGTGFDEEQRLVRERWLQSLAFPCMVLSGLQIAGMLRPYSLPLIVVWLIAATYTAGATLRNAIRGWVLWWHRRSP